MLVKHLIASSLPARDPLSMQLPACPRASLPVGTCGCLQINSLRDALLHQINSSSTGQQNTGAEQQRDKAHRLICSPHCSLSATWGKNTPPRAPSVFTLSTVSAPNFLPRLASGNAPPRFPLPFHLPAISMLPLALLQGMAPAQRCCGLPHGAAGEPVWAGSFCSKTCVFKLKKEKKKKSPHRMFLKLPRIASSLAKLEPGNCPLEEKVGNECKVSLVVQGQGTGACSSPRSVPGGWEGQRCCPLLGQPSGDMGTWPGVCFSTGLVLQAKAGAQLVPSSFSHSFPGSAPSSFHPAVCSPLHWAPQG